jgi:hypothetical protein
MQLLHLHYPQFDIHAVQTGQHTLKVLLNHGRLESGEDDNFVRSEGLLAEISGVSRSSF